MDNGQAAGQAGPAVVEDGDFHGRLIQSFPQGHFADADVVGDLADLLDGQGVVAVAEGTGWDGQGEDLVVLVGRQPAQFLAVEHDLPGLLDILLT
jgi:hypothetical protein